MVWVIAFGELFFGDLWCVVWGYGGMRTHFSLLNPHWPAVMRPSLPQKISNPGDMHLKRRDRSEAFGSKCNTGTYVIQE